MAIVEPSRFLTPTGHPAMSIAAYAGLLPDAGPTDNSWFPGYEEMPWPSTADAQYPMYEPPPFYLQRRGGHTAMPQVLYTGSPDITAYQDMQGSASLGYPFPPCAQQLPMTNNWSGHYVPDDSLTNWIENNPVAATLLALAVMGVGVWFNGGQK